MISIGRFTERTCQGLTRRAFLQISASAPFAWAFRTSSRRHDGAGAGGRSILLIWLGGRPSHLDLFDPKPKAACRVSRAVRDDRDQDVGRPVH